MKFIRTFWGDVHRMGGRYSNQIKEAVSDNLDEKVYVWGRDNFEFISSLGFDCELISEYKFNPKLATDHTFFDHKSLNHKLWILNYAMKQYDEIVFLDWDCRLIRPIDKLFYDLLRSGGDLQVPLYTYPYKAIDFLKEKTKDSNVNPFFYKLEKFIKQYSYHFKENYVIPNTGFIYCRDKDINLLDISLDNELEAVPDEFAVYKYAYDKDYLLRDYIKRIEPNVIRGKKHEEEWWITEQNEFDFYVDSLKTKTIYFDHK